MKYVGQDRVICTMCGELRGIESFYIGYAANRREEYKIIKMPCKVCVYRRRNERIAKQVVVEEVKVVGEKPKVMTCAANCEFYPCFKGIDTMSSNLAKTCCHFKAKEQ